MRQSEAAPAKLNLALHVRRRRPDGYHELETLFAFVADGDVVAVDEGEALSLTIEGPMADGLSAADNLVLSAARRLATSAGIAPRARLTLTKNLPVASGIGGGSADAAAALRLLNRFWGLDYSLGRLAELAEPLGADVPACVYSRTMWGGGKGETLVPADVAGLNDMPVLLVNPMVPLATGPVFAAWDGVDRGPLDSRPAIDDLVRARNDLQSGAISLCPPIADVLTALAACGGALLSRMSGSGATCFALFESEAALRLAHDDLAAREPGWWLLPTRVKIA